LPRSVSYADAEQAPEWFTTTPAHGNVPKAVARAGLKMEDIEYWELNEAFAVVGYREYSRRMKLDPSKCQCAMGERWRSDTRLERVGQAIIVTTAAYVLTSRIMRSMVRRGFVMVGGGAQSAMVIENLQV
jgi:acetyl-CoA C-acetyltransferase